MTSPFRESYWSWYHEAVGMGFEIISFAVARYPPLDVIHFAGKVGVGVVIQDYILNSTSIDWKGKCDFNLGLRERVSCVFYVCFNIIVFLFFSSPKMYPLRIF